MHDGFYLWNCNLYIYIYISFDFRIFVYPFTFLITGTRNYFETEKRGGSYFLTENAQKVVIIVVLE